MPVLHREFVVDAPQAAVSAFHDSPEALQRLTPPPMRVRLQDFGPMREGMVARFRLGLGPVHIRWVAEHTDVGQQGFTDIQREGPLRSWRHTHRFVPEGPRRTRVIDHVEYAHPRGPRGVLTRLLFARPALSALFAYRAAITRRALRRARAPEQLGPPSSP